MFDLIDTHRDHIRSEYYDDVTEDIQLKIFMML